MEQFSGWYFDNADILNFKIANMLLYVLRTQ